MPLPPRPPPLDRVAYLAYFEAWLVPKVTTGELSVARFGAAAVGEPSIIAKLRAGKRKVTFETLEKMMEFCDNYEAWAAFQKERAKLQAAVVEDAISP